MQYSLEDICGKIDVFEIAKREEDIFLGFAKDLGKHIYLVIE